MYTAILLLVIFATVSSAYRLAPRRVMPAAAAATKFHSSQLFQLNMAEEFKPVPVDDVNVRNAATVTGSILGLVLGGPVISLVFAAGTNYLVKQDGDSGEAFRGVGKAVVDAYNYVNKLNSKYQLTDKVSETVSTTLNNDSKSEALDTVKKTVSKIDDLNKEYDLVGKGKLALTTSVELADVAIEKTIELNAKYDFVGTSKKLIEQLISKIKEYLDSRAA